jgi:hypothetical protein
MVWQSICAGANGIVFYEYLLLRGTFNLCHLNPLQLAPTVFGSISDENFIPRSRYSDLLRNPDVDFETAFGAERAYPVHFSI